MSFIQFESGRVKDAAREALRKSREAVLAQAEADHFRKQRRQEQAKLRGEDQWILPSVESRLNVDKKSEKKAKKADKKKKSKKKKKQRSKSSSSSDTTSEDEWIEKDKDKKPIETPDLVAKSNIPETSVVRDEWMTLPGLFPCVNFSEEREARKQRNKEKNDKGTIDQLGQSDRELNPYWKNGGTGLPTALKDNTKINTTSHQSKSDEQSRKSVRVATSKLDIEPHDDDVGCKNNRSYEARDTDTKRYRTSEYRSHGRDSASSSSWKTSDRNKQRSRSRSNSRDRGRSRKESRADNRYKSPSRSPVTKRHYQDKFNSEKKLPFKKPRSDDFASTSSSSNNSSLSRSKNWKKPNASVFEKESSRVNVSEKESSQVTISDKLSENHCAPKGTVCTQRVESPNKDETETDTIMTEAEMNQLGAKIVKCEIMGDDEMASQLKAKLEKAREARKNNPSNSKEEETTIILTKTDSRGMTKPIEPRSAYEEPKDGRRKKKKMNTHESGQRVRYFADDDRFSIQDMFQQEKDQSTNDDAAAFVKAASKGMDMDEIFEDRVRYDENESKRDERDRLQAIKTHKKMSNSLDNCKLCVNSRQMLKHMIVAMGDKVYMSLPSHESLTTGHCILAPIHHVTCQTLLDEDVWAELQTFKKTLTKMFQDQDEDVIFFEISIGHRYFPHMQLECIPVSKETGDLAPIYFKKALLECEMEWSMNKKVIDLGGKNIQQAVPKGLAYFTVDFGMQPGFAHVIEDEKLFPRTFAQEIIAGMLDLDRNVWRKPRRENFDQQRSKVIEFASIWKKYDFTTGDDSD